MSIPRVQVGRGDWILGRLLLVVFCLPALIRLAGLVVGALTGRPLVWQGLADDTPAVSPPPEQSGATGVHTPDVQWTLTEPLPIQWLGAMLPSVVELACWAAVAVLLWPVLRQMAGGDPFGPSNAARVRNAGVVLTVYAAVVVFMPLLAGALVTTPMQGGRLSVLLRPDVAALWPAVIGLYLVLIGEAFRRGAQLRADVEGLV